MRLFLPVLKQIIASLLVGGKSLSHELFTVLILLFFYLNLMFGSFIIIETVLTLGETLPRVK